MQARDYPAEKVNTVANYAILSQADNAELADREQFDVWTIAKAQPARLRVGPVVFIANENFFKAYED
ncbi:MAG: hypothetical protein ABSG65_25040 [Bryobacteraceae bacterium]